MFALKYSVLKVLYDNLIMLLALMCNEINQIKKKNNIKYLNLTLDHTYKRRLCNTVKEKKKNSAVQKIKQE